MHAEDDGRRCGSGKLQTQTHSPTEAKNRAGYGAKRFLWMLILVAFICPFSVAATDILFLVDTTASMGGIGVLKTVLDDLLTVIDANSLCSDTLMYAVADYRDIDDGRNYQAYGVNLILPFTSSIEDVRSAINGLSKGDGGDYPESQLKAMVSIADNWLTSYGNLGFGGRLGAQRILIWAGDAPGHIAGDSPVGYYPSLDETIAALTTQCITVFALNPTNCDDDLNEPYGSPPRQQASEITAATGGKLFCNVGYGGPNIEDDIVGAILCVSLFKDDGIDPNDCVVPDQTITYEICWTNDSSQTIYDAYILDRLPEGVSYPQGAWSFEMGDPNDPNAPPLSFIPPDSGYDSESHSYVWALGNIGSMASGCVELDVVVNGRAIPGGTLHNVAEVYGTVYDPNSQIPYERLIARAIRNTNICCYAGTVEELYVDKSATQGNNTGLDWPNAFLDLQDALAYARTSICADINSIYVAQGPYSPGDDASDTFEIPDGIAVYGGFPKGGGEFWQRNPKTYQTTLTGKINDTERNETVVRMLDNTLLDGVTVTGAGPYPSGRGILGSDIDFTVANCTIANNLGYGAYIEDCNSIFLWVNFQNNEADGIFHEGEGCELVVENCWIRQSGGYGIVSLNSTPVIKNSIISESDMSREGREGIRMINPANQPVLHNNTFAHNKSAGIFFVDDQTVSDPNGKDWPDMQNCILWYNNVENDGRQFTGFSKETVHYSCIYEPNDPDGEDQTLDANYNFSTNPQLAYLDPNNVHILYASPCRDAGNPLMSYDAQFDMDGNVRVLGTTADVGAYEIDCEDGSNEWDLNADGIVNLREFVNFSRAWLSHDPDDPAWLADPNLADPSLSEGWYDWKYKFNLDDTGYSAYQIDLADLLKFVDEAPWLWVACWRTDLQPVMMQALSGTVEMSSFGLESYSISGFESQPFEPQIVQGKSTQEQILEMVTAIVSLEQLWLDEPQIQQQISPEKWQGFMDAIHLKLYDLATESVPIK